MSCPAPNFVVQSGTMFTPNRIVLCLVMACAVASGQTIYDAAISNTVIDQEQGRFDPVWSAENSWKHTETPTAVFDPSASVPPLTVVPPV